MGDSPGQTVQDGGLKGKIQQTWWNNNNNNNNLKQKQKQKQQNLNLNLKLKLKQQQGTETERLKGSYWQEKICVTLLQRFTNRIVVCLLETRCTAGKMWSVRQRIVA